MERRRTHLAPIAPDLILPTTTVPADTLETAGRAGTLPRRVRREIAVSNKPAVGDLLGAYELVGLLGRGTTSMVFHGRHRKLQIPVAVKVLHQDELANSPQ